MATLANNTAPISADRRWRDMSTAPRDGTAVRLLICDRDADGCPINEREIVAGFSVLDVKNSSVYGQTHRSGGEQPGWDQIGHDTRVREDNALGWLPRTSMVHGKLEHDGTPYYTENALTSVDSWMYWSD